MQMNHQDLQNASEVVKVLKALPQHVLQEPLIYLSSAQRNICLSNHLLKHAAPHLPGWVSHRTVARALGLSQVAFAHSCMLVSFRCIETPFQNGIDLALSCNAPYVWATEFENVRAKPLILLPKTPNFTTVKVFVVCT